MWRRCQSATVKTRLVDEASHTPGEETAPSIQSAKGPVVGIARDINIARIDRGPVVKLGIHNNVRFVIPGAGKEVCPLFTHVVGKAEIGVAIVGVNFDATKSVSRPDIKHTRHRVRAVDGRSTVLQDIDVINQPKWKHIEVDRITGKANWR